MKFLYLLLFFIHVSATAQNSEILIDATAEEIMEVVHEQENKKPVLLNVWATWCAPCIEEMPYILELNEK